MNRRGFLKLLGIGAAAAVAPAIILPERRIWAVGFGAPRDVHAALAGHPGFGWDPGFGDNTGFIWARWDDEAGKLVYADVDKAEALADTRRIGSQDLTFERPSEETLRLWRDAPEANVPGVLTREAILDVGRTYTATLTGVIASHAAKRA